MLVSDEVAAERNGKTEVIRSLLRFSLDVADDKPNHPTILISSTFCEKITLKCCINIIVATALSSSSFVSLCACECVKLRS